MTPLTPSQRLDSLDDLLLYRLRLLADEAGALVVRVCEGRHGITRREWRVLGLLHGYEGLPPSALAERVQLDRARTSRAISSLVAKKLIARRASPADRRGATLSLTPAGHRVYEALMPEVQEINRRILGVLSPQEMQQLDAWLSRLQGSAQVLAAEMTPVLPKTYRLRGKRQAVQPVAED